MSVAQQAKRVRKRLSKTRPPRGKSTAAKAKSDVFRQNMAKKKK